MIADKLATIVSAWRAALQAQGLVVRDEPVSDSSDYVLVVGQSAEHEDWTESSQIVRAEVATIGYTRSEQDMLAKFESAYESLRSMLAVEYVSVMLVRMAWYIEPSTRQRRVVEIAIECIWDSSL